MQRWNERQQQELRELEDDFKLNDKLNKWVGIIFVVLCIVRGVVVKGLFGQGSWEWSYVDFLEGFTIGFGILFVVSLITVLIKQQTLSLRQEVIRLRYRIEAIEKDGESV